MKKISSFILALFIGVIAYAQKLPTRVAVKAGIAVPLDDLGSTDENNRSGFAQTGRSYGLDIMVPIYKKIQLTAGYSNNSYSINKNAFDAYTERLIKARLSSDGISTTNQFALTSALKDYKNNNLLAGIKVDFKINEKLDAYVNPKFAYSFVKLPGWGAVASDSANLKVGVSQNEVTTKEFGFTFSTGLSYKVSNNLGVILDFTTYNSTHRPTVRGRYVDQNGANFDSEEELKNDFSSYTVTVGILINLNQTSDE